MRKRILQPDEIQGLYTHWPELEERKLSWIRQRNAHHTRVFDRPRGQTVGGTVLNVDPIVTAPLDDENRIVLNGKHRSVLACLRNIGVVAYEVEADSDILHALPASAYRGVPSQDESIEDSSPQALFALYQNRDLYLRICQERGVVTIQDHIAALGFTH